MNRQTAILACLLSVFGAGLRAQSHIGTSGVVGTLDNPRTVSRLEITKSGVYENFHVDAMGKGGNTVKITANDVVLRHCEIHHGSGNGIGIFGTNVVIENCRIHHILNGTFQNQQDAHGISGHWGNVTIRNCDISYTSGDAIQFDPGRTSRGSLIVEHCRLWTGPLPAAASGFKAGERPGENAIDTKTKPDGDRCKLIIRNCYLHGWNQPAQISNVAALNLKEHIDCEVHQCVFADNEVALRVRGPGGRGGAHVSIYDCAIYESEIGVRAEDKIEKLKIKGLAFGKGVKTRIKFVNGPPTAGFEHLNERTAPSLESLLKSGFAVQ